MTRKINYENYNLIVTRNDFPSFVKELGEIQLPETKKIVVKTNIEEIEKKQTKFESFLKLFRFEKKIAIDKTNETKPPLKEEAVINNDKTEIEKEVTVLLQQGDFESVAELMNNGYECNRSQRIFLAESLLTKYEESRETTISRLSRLINKGFKIPNEFLEGYIFDFSFQIYTREYFILKQRKNIMTEDEFRTKHSKSEVEYYSTIQRVDEKFRPITNVVEQYYDNIDNKITILNICLNLMEEYPARRSAYIPLRASLLPIMKYMCEGIMNEISDTKRTEIILSMKDLSKRAIQGKEDPEVMENIDEIIKVLERGKVVNSVGFDELLKKTKEVYQNSKKVEKQNILEGKENLTEEIKDKINYIESLYEFIVKNKNSVQMNQYSDMEILVTKRLPDFIKSYNAITNSFSLVELEMQVGENNQINEIQESENSLKEIISDITECLEKITKDIRLVKMSELNAGRNYVKNYKPV